MTELKPTIITYIPEEGFQDERDVESALEGVKQLIEIERQECISDGEWGTRSDTYAIYVAYPLYTSELVQCPHTDEEAFDLEIIPHPPNFKLADGKTNVFQLVKELHEANERLAAQQKRIEELEKKYNDAADKHLALANKYSDLADENITLKAENAKQKEWIEDTYALCERALDGKTPLDIFSAVAQLVAYRADLMSENERLREGLKPFADFASSSAFEKLPDDMPLTQGSSLALKQVTAGEFRKAFNLLKGGSDNG